MSIFKNDPLRARRFYIPAVILLLVIGLLSPAYADWDVPSKKQTSLGLYLNAWQAWEKWSAAPETIHILDVRTVAEYVFIGHAPMAVNIPLKFLKEELSVLTLSPAMPDNENFIADVKKRFKETDTIYVMCRSGGRSAAAVNLMARAGFKQVYNIIDGFEGDALKEADSYNDGKRIINGWKNSGAPWTYEMERKLAYLP